MRKKATLVRGILEKMPHHRALPGAAQGPISTFQILFVLQCVAIYFVTVSPKSR